MVTTQRCGRGSFPKTDVVARRAARARTRVFECWWVLGLRVTTTRMA